MSHLRMAPSWFPFELSENWYEAPNVASLLTLDRPFIFPGEQLHIILHISVHHPAESSIITPFKIAAAIEKGSQYEDYGSDSVQDSTESSQENLQELGKIKTPKSAKSSLKGKWFNTTPGGNLVAITEWLDEQQSEDDDGSSESQKRRTALLLESFQKSHFHVKVGKRADGIATKPKDGVGRPEQSEEDLSDEDGPDTDSPGTAYGCKPVVTEDGKFEPFTTGGLARGATSCWSLRNGDVVVLLQVTMASEFLSNSAELEVLQYEPYVTPPAYPMDDQFQEMSKNPTEGLLQWLLPLDRPSSPPPPASAPQPALTPSPSGRLSFAGGGNSTFFSFSHVRSSSVGSITTPAPPPVVTYTPPPPPTYGPEEWGRFSFEKDSQGEVGSEGLLSFRGAALEPQRFSAHGLSGPYVPGKRWKRTLAILQPVRLESYFADCNTQDLICILVENSLPATGMTADVVIYVDSVSIVCQSASPGSLPLPVPIACVEVGEDHSLPGLALRPGEQHSFILRPVSQAWLTGKQPAVEDGTPRYRSSQDGQGIGNIKTRRGSNHESDCGEYAILVSCHCSHTESRLHFKHSLTWRPRPPRDLLLSVALENYSPAKLSGETLAQLTPQVVRVQATNLTSQDMNLTLLAPSSMAGSSLSIVSFPGNDTPVVSKSSEHQQSLTVREVLAMEDSASESKLSSQLSSRRMSLPPVQPMEMVLGIKPTVLKERIISDSDAAADSGSARTHLWLQSTVPLGRLPPHATTAVRCELLPLTSGIITLDTLHIATNEHDALYIPENSLQVYCTSSLASGVS
uniref:Uncharacterized protein n=1 Tax=Physcomitrium patens TaxID=3218 RepID=A0A7I4BA18_PHYPA